MRRTARAAAIAAVVLSGCPLPQPLPDYPEGQPVTPPRIVVDDTVRAVLQPESIVRVPAGCPREPVFPLGATLRDAITNEAVVARWFVNYDPTNRPSLAVQQANDILAPGDGTVDPTLRETPAFQFPAYQYPSAGGSAAAGTAGALHVVELVVSNGFDPNADVATATSAYRKPKLGFEVQVYRWVFLTVPPSPDGCTGAGCVTCPAPPVVPAG
ncbi:MULTISPECIES: hypothetical protein [Anaeromyxobacter]|uniref:hypothetical protein n=1 Tax=Anaeromyxobacter TaxID=161492 RepID=UPI001F5AD7BF|nr:MULTISPECIES: hypothetical protein [unclassified Anaeromyxobacter]